VEFNANWAKGAAVMAIAVADLAFERNNAPNRNPQDDLGAATALLSVEATAQGFALHLMAGLAPEKARQLSGIRAESEVIAACAVADTGHLSFFTSLFYVILAAVAADSIWYQLGRRKGIKILQLLCEISLEPDSCVRRTEGVFSKQGARSLLLAKFLPGLSTVAPPLAGIFHMRPRRFLFFDALG